VGFQILDSSKFNVPQRRRRVFVVGIRDGEPGQVEKMFGGIDKVAAANLAAQTPEMIAVRSVLDEDNPPKQWLYWEWGDYWKGKNTRGGGF
jgi:site-specific DNA-cytosine methylase